MPPPNHNTPLKGNTQQPSGHKLIIGLTGGIGSGKTAASECFETLGIQVIDADVISRSISQTTVVIQAIADHFGPNILLPDGLINRPKLREIIFSNPEEKRWLENLLHPKIRETIKDQIQAATSPYVILSAPLLLENHLEHLTDRVLVIDLPEADQILRTLQRDQCPESVVLEIMKAQLSRQDRLSRADDVIDNSQGLIELKAQAQALHEKYLKLCI